MKLYAKLLSSLIICGVIPSMTACGDDNNSSFGNGTGSMPQSRRTVEALTDFFWHNSTCRNLDENRIKAMYEMQVYADLCPNTYFKQYYASTSESKDEEMEKNSILGYHKKALERLLDIVPTDVVPDGHIVLYQLYNMGYIVKTPSHCFGIDLKHKDAARLEPLIEFLCITHEHEDHYTTALNEAMAAAGKPVYSNFLDNGHKITGTKTIKPVGDIEIRTKIVDHNSSLKNFVVTYQIDCGKDAGNKVVLHCGDAYTHTQLEKTKDVDIFIPHLANGLDMNATVSKIDPKIVLMSHILELDHPVEQWRWSYQEGIKRTSEVNRSGVYLPVWGERFEY